MFKTLTDYIRSNPARSSDRPAVHADADGNLKVNGLPALPQLSDGAVRCPYGCTGRHGWHYHGRNQRDLIENRVAHCRAGSGRSYYTLKYIAGPLGNRVRFWEDLSSPLNFGIPAAARGGLMMEVA